MAVQTNTPNTVRIGYQNQNLLTSSDLLDIHALAAEAVDPKLFGRYGREKLGVMPLVDMYGTKESVSASQYGHFESDRTREIIRITDSYSSGGATATFTVASTTPDYLYSYPTAASETWYTNYTTAYTTTVRKDDIIVADGIELLVTANPTYASTTTFTVECTQTGEVIPAGLEDVEIWIKTRSKAEAGSDGDGRTTRMVRYTNNIQIIDETYTTSGTALGTKSVFNNLGGNSEYAAAYDILNTRTNFDAMCELAILTGQKTTSTTATFNQRLTTEGVITGVINYGNEANYTIGSYSLTDVDNMLLTLAKEYAGDEYVLICDKKFARDWDNAWRTLVGPDHGVAYNQDLLQLGFAGVNRLDTKLYKKTLQGFSDPKTLGSADSEYQNIAVWMPNGNQTAFDLGGQPVEKYSLCLRYQDVQGENQGMFENYTGGTGGAFTNNDDKYTVYMRKRLGVEMYGLNSFGIQRGTVG